MKKYSLVYIFLSFNLLYGGVGQQTVDMLQSLIGTWTQLFSSHAVFVLYGLAVIDMVLTFGFMALKGELEFQGIMFNLIRITLIIGFFLLLIGNTGVVILKAIIDSFSQLGAQASGNNITADNVFIKVVNVYNNLYEDLSFSITSLVIALLSILIVLILIKVGVKILTALVFATLSIYMAALFFAFGVFNQTRTWAINALVNAVRYGARYMGTLIMVGIALGFIENITNLAGKDLDSASLMGLLVFTLLLNSLAEGIEDFIDGYITGLGGGSNFAAGQMLKQIASSTAAIARNAAQGVKGGGAAAIQQVKDANSAASAAGTSKVGRWRSAAGVAGGAMAGAFAGMARGAMGFKTYEAGKGVGAKAGSMASSAANKASSAATTPSKSKETKEPTLKPGDKGYYNSSVPPQKDFR